MQNNEFHEQIRLQQQIVLLENLTKQYLTKEAIARYGNLKAAHPQKALQVIASIANAIQSGLIKEKIDDNQFKQFLMKLEPPKKEFKFLRK